MKGLTTGADPGLLLDNAAGCVSQFVVIKFVVSLAQCILNGDVNARQANDCCGTHPD